MYLTRPEEISTKDQHLLQEHLAVCVPCRAEYSRVVAAASYIDRLRHTPPIISSPDLLADRAMSAISNREVLGAPSRRHGIIETVFGFLFRPDVRIGYAIILICMLSLGFAQGLDVLISVHQLEKGATHRGKQNSGISVAYAIQTTSLHDLPAALTSRVMPELFRTTDEMFILSKETTSRMAGLLQTHSLLPFLVRDAGLDRNALTLFLRGTELTSFATVIITPKER